MLKLSTKQRRDVYALSNLLVHVLVFLILLLSLNSCTEKDLPTTACNTLATVKDLRGLDGCGFVFVLDNGQKLEPVLSTGWCGTPPFPDFQTNPLQKFTLKDGQRVTIGYKAVDAVSICMVGQSVEITCISEVSNSGRTNDL